MELKEVVDLFNVVHEHDAGSNPGRRDLKAFNLLDRILPKSDADIIGSAGHDEIMLNVNMEDFAAVATPEIIRELRSYGVLYDYHYECLMMFV